MTAKRPEKGEEMNEQAPVAAVKDGAPHSLDPEFLSALLDASPFRMILVAPDRTILYANEAMRRSSGVDLAAEGMKCSDLSECQSGLSSFTDNVCPVTAVLESSEPVQIDHGYLLPEGDSRIDQVLASPILNEAGEVLYIYISFVDVTSERMLAKDQRRRDVFMAALNESVQRVLRSANPMPYQDFVTTIGPASGASRACVFINHHGENGELMMSLSGEWCTDGLEPQTSNPKLQNIVYSESCPRWESALSRGKAIRGAVRSFPDGEKAILKEQNVVSLLLLPLRIDDRFVGVIGFMNCESDYEWAPSERAFFRAAGNFLSQAISSKKMEEARLRLEQQVLNAQKMESLGLLAGAIAHDFNNLLVSILGNADLALLDVEEEHPAYSSVKEIEIGARKAGELTRQMLTYAGGGQFSTEIIDLSASIERVHHLLQTSLPKPVSLDFDLKRDLPAIDADTAQLQQILINLVRNAAEALVDRPNGVIKVSTYARECDRAFLDEGTINVRRKGDPLPEGTYVVLEVADNGCGMDAETRERIFDPFFSTKVKGRGLGMAAVMGIVRTHDAAIDLFSQPNTGSVFTILFPAAEGEVAVEAEIDEEEVLSWRTTGSMLVIDDDINIIRVASRVLESTGLTILSAQNGEEGVEVYRKHADDIVCVLLDLAMPKKDGAETFREIRKINSEAKVVLSSGYGKKDVSERFKEPGLAAFLQKPYNTVKLIATIRSVIDPAD